MCDRARLRDHIEAKPAAGQRVDEVSRRRVLLDRVGDRDAHSTVLGKVLHHLPDLVLRVVLPTAVQRSVRWPGSYDFYTLQETGRIGEATALQVARCTPASTRSDYWIYPADFFKLRDVSLSVPIPARYITGASSVHFTISGKNVWKWVNKDFPTQDPETGNNGGFDSRVRSLLEHVPPPATFMASMRVTF